MSEQQEDWRGEHLIRGVKRAEVRGCDHTRKKQGHGGGPPRKMVAESTYITAKCAVPDCRRVISARAPSKVCRDHLHAAGFCKCNYCQTGNWGS